MKDFERTAAPPNPAALQCPPAPRRGEVIVLGHGSGGRLTAELVRNVFLTAFSNPILGRLNDSAEVKLDGGRLALTTDSFVVSPLRFPGGDIGSLAVNGTINDLAVVGAQPLGLSAAFILEEGFPIAMLRQFVDSMGETARRAGVPIVAADTKVVERGSADGMFITTSGFGLIAPGLELGPELARPGDVVLVSGPVGDHGIAVMSAREGLAFETTLVSDCAPLHRLAALMIECGGAALRCMRDVTRGGLATVVNELAQSSGVEIILEEEAVPVREAVRSACEILGLDPLYVACEGRLAAIVDASHADRMVAAMRRDPLGQGACRVGSVVRSGDPRVLLRTAFGPTRLLDVLPGEQLPRIC